MDAGRSDTKYDIVSPQHPDEACSTISPQMLMEESNHAAFEDVASSDMQYTQAPPQNQLDAECTELLLNQPCTEYTQLLVTDATADELWPVGLSSEFIEQCVQTLDVIHDSSTLTEAVDGLALLAPSMVSVESWDRIIFQENVQEPMSLENLEAGHFQMLENEPTEEDSPPMSAISEAEISAQHDATDSVQPHVVQCTPETHQADVKDCFGASGQLRPSSSPLPVLTSSSWAERPDGPSPLLGHQVCQAPVDIPASSVSREFSHSRLQYPAPSEGRAVWTPPAAARLSEVECELTVSEETEQEVAPPGSVPPSGEPTPYQEHNYDYPLEPLVAGEVRPSADHQYASRPASPGGDACSATDHRYAYSPPAALTEEDLIRSISDQLGLPQDHGYSQRQGPAAAPVAPQPLPAPAAPSQSTEPPPELVPEPSLVTESCPPDWEPMLDEPAGHWVDPNLVMGLTSGWQREEEVGAGDEAGEGTADLLDGADAVFLDEALWESGLEVLDEEGEKYLVLDVVQPSEEELNEATRMEWQDSGISDAEPTPVDKKTLAAAETPARPVGSDPAVSESDSELTQLLWAVAGSALLSSESDVPAIESEPSLSSVQSEKSDKEAETEVLQLPATDQPARTANESATSTLATDNLSALAALASVASNVLDDFPVETSYAPTTETAKAVTVADPPLVRDTTCARVHPQSTPFEIAVSSAMSYDWPAEAAESITAAVVSQCPDTTAPAQLQPARSAAPSVTKTSACLSTNIVISRPAADDLSPPRLPERDPATAVLAWLRQRAAAQQPVTRAGLSAELAALLGPDGRRRLSEDGSYLALWLDRLAAVQGKRVTENDSGGKPVRIGYPPQFKLLLLRFVEFMTAEEVAAAFCVPLAVVYKWRAARRQLAEMAASAAVCVRAKGGGKKRRPTEVDAEFADWLQRRRRDTAAPPTYQEVRRVARRMYVDAGLSVPHSRHWQRQVPDVTDRRREHTAVRWLLTEFEQGRATSRPALAAYGQQPGGQFWAARLLARHRPLGRPLATWQMQLPEPLLAEAEHWAGRLQPPPPHAVVVMADVPISTRPAPCAVWRSEDSEHLATLLISCTLEGSVQPPMLIMKGGGRQVYSDSSGLLTAQQEDGRLDAARAGLWLQLVGCRGPAQLLLLNSCCAPRPEQLRSQAAAAGRRVALIPPGLAAAANPLMASRQRLMLAIATALSEGRADADLLAAVRAQLADWGDPVQLRHELARVERLYRAPGG
ncbi:uncharacterized protein LOC122381443 [Amphibalanus amphitrite]|uniref:uncharacterized protein LOC122381443 n=1 Tax=Amphibalanus amphitrite TaxID=1232801 RepID=UPI001C914899|nr:uncharacterized protein LOC122381443 [Amphibalanus amphitrite]